MDAFGKSESTKKSNNSYFSSAVLNVVPIENFSPNFQHQIAVSSTYLFRYLTLRLWSLPINYISNLDNYRVVVMEKCQNEVADDVTGEVDNMAPITQTLCLLRIE